MSEIETLVSKYQDQVELPWPKTLAPAERVWFLIYDKTQERRLRPRLVSSGVRPSRCRSGGTGIWQWPGPGPIHLRRC